MRTTLNLDSDALHIVQRFAKGRRISIGKAVSDLIRRSVSARVPTKMLNGLPVFDLPEDSPAVTSETVSRLLNEES